MRQWGAFVADDGGAELGDGIEEMSPPQQMLSQYPFWNAI
jgi:hypothetical protein